MNVHNSNPPLPPTLQPVVVQTSDDYDGIERMMVDKLLTQEQCDQLIQLASVSGNNV